jgi:hypothetical protein
VGNLQQRVRYSILTKLLWIVLFAGGAGVSGCGRAIVSVSYPPDRPTAFAVARSQRTPEDALPQQVVDALLLSTRPEFVNADLQFARRILPLSPGWLVPAKNREVCLVRLVEPLIPQEHGVPLQPAVSTLCQPESSAQEGRLIEAQALTVHAEPYPLYRVVGVVPDGARRVELLYGSHGREFIATKRNAYESIVRAPRTIRFVTGGTDAVQHSVPVLPSGSGVPQH